jgi:hypothetical protein
MQTVERVNPVWLMVLVVLSSLAITQTNQAQQPPDITQHTYEIYVSRATDPGQRDRLFFLDVLTGETVELITSGERYTPLSGGVIFYEPAIRQVMLAAPDGTLRAHPFIQLQSTQRTDRARRVDWIVSRDGRQIAWTLTFDDPAGLSTETYLASPTGAGQRLIRADGPRDGVRFLPVAFSVDNNALIMDAHPDGLGRFAPYTQYAGLFRLSLSDGSIESLPGEPGCFCGAALRAGLFLRLTLTDDLSGFDVVVHNLNTGQSRTIPAARPGGTYTQAGDILIAPDGTQAVYALSQIDNFGAADQSVRTLFMRVDLQGYTQQPLTDPITTYVHPVRWTEDNTAVLFTSPQRPGTWKISPGDGRLLRVADASYLGTLHINTESNR